MTTRREILKATAAAAVAAAAPSVTLAAAPWRVFRVSDYEWYVARSPLEALTAAAYDWGCKDCPAEIGALIADLDTLKFADSDEHDRIVPGSVRTFRQELERRIAAGLDAPEFFAGSEW